MTKLWVKFKTYNATQISTEECQNVEDFLKACKKELPQLLGSYAAQLCISTTDSGSPLQPHDPIPALNTAQTPLFISVANCSFTTGSCSSSESTIKAPHPKRKERWEKLNEILEKNKKKSNTIDSTSYSYVSWNHVRNELKVTPYIQSSKAIPDIQFDILSQYLSFVTKCLGPVSVCQESQRIHFIAPIIVSVCSLFNGDVIMDVEEDGDGRAHEFVLRRGAKKVCIVEPKNAMDQGLKKGLLESVVAGSVYGIVTNYVQWNFLRSLDKKIELEECFLNLMNGAVTKESLTLITGKIYAMFSDE